MQTKPGRDKDRLLTQDAQSQGPAPSHTHKNKATKNETKQTRKCMQL